MVTDSIATLVSVTVLPDHEALQAWLDQLPDGMHFKEHCLDELLKMHLQTRSGVELGQEIVAAFRVYLEGWYGMEAAPQGSGRHFVDGLARVIDGMALHASVREGALDYINTIGARRLKAAIDRLDADPVVSTECFFADL